MKVVASPRNIEQKLLPKRSVAKANISCIISNPQARPFQHFKSFLKERKSQNIVGKNIPNFIRMKQALKANLKNTQAQQDHFMTMNERKLNNQNGGNRLKKIESLKSFQSHQFLKKPSFFKPIPYQNKWPEMKSVVKADDASDSTMGESQNSIKNKVTASKSYNCNILKKVASACSLKPKSLSICTNSRKIQKFKIGRKLGQGKCGKVYLAQQIKTKMIFAIKVIQKQSIKQKNLINQLIRELSIQITLNHPNIIKVYDIFDNFQNIYIVQEFATDGDLYELMNKKQTGVSQKAASYIANQILNGLDYLHSQQIFHRDIKPQNIMLMFDSIKIADFGCAIHKVHHEELRNTFIGTPLYVSPELILGCPYNEKVDLWALGILTYELVFNENPFKIKHKHHLKKIVNDEINYAEIEGSQIFKEFLSNLLEKNPSKRMKASQILNSSFITAYDETIYCEELIKDS